MTEPGPLISIVIPAYNAGDVLGDCLDSIARVVAGRKDVEVLVIDNNSRDDTGEQARARGVAPLSCKTPGPSAARNVGVQSARGDAIVFVDADVIVEPGWLDALLEPLADPAVGGVGGCIVPHRLKTGPEWHAATWMLKQEQMVRGRPPYMLPFAATANAVFRTGALRSVGGFDEALRVGEDADLAWRLQWAGWRIVYAGSARVRHRFRTTKRAYFRQIAAYGEGTVGLFAKHRRRLGRRVWIEWEQFIHLGRSLLWTPIMLVRGRTGWDRVSALYSLVAGLAWLAGRLKGSMKHRVLVI